ncbi:MAG: HAMP domain-containing sensor histidine kinase [Verrucomicrobiota bacterium]
MNKLQLRDHIEQLLSFIVKDIESPQTASQQISKSHGENDSDESSPESAAEIHGLARHHEGFDIIQMVSEYRALRSSIIKLWTKSKTILADIDLVDLTRFNESIDQALAESVMRFMGNVTYSKDLILGVLAHDIRSPLAAIKMCASLLPLIGTLNEKQTSIASQMEKSSVRANKIVADLLDLARSQLGSGLSIRREPMNMGVVAQEVVNEVQIQYANRPIVLNIIGNVEGNWDMTRLGQLFSNLISNAVQYGSDASPIQVTVKGDPLEVIISVQNECDPIPPLQLISIFDSFTRGKERSGVNDEISTNLGLGLFITKEIATAHEGLIDVISNAIEGTIFTVRLPK